MEKLFRLYLELVPKLVLGVIENYPKFPVMCCKGCRNCC